MLQNSMTYSIEHNSHRILFLSATEYFPSRTIIQPWWVSSLSLSSLSLSSWPFSQWDNSRTLWAIQLKFCMVTSHDYLLWIRIREPISPTQTGPTSQISIFGKKFHNGLTLPIFVRFGSNFVQRSLVSLSRDSECLKWLRPFFDLPARPTKIDQKWKFLTSMLFVRFGWNLVCGLKMEQKQLRMS